MNQHDIDVYVARSKCLSPVLSSHLGRRAGEGRRWEESIGTARRYRIASHDVISFLGVRHEGVARVQHLLTVIGTLLFRGV